MYLPACLYLAARRCRGRFHAIAFLSLALVFASAAFSASAQAGLESAQDFLAGGKSGLYRVALRQSDIETRSIWNEGAVRSIVPFSGGWYFVTSHGIIFSPDLQGFESRSEGLPMKTLKVLKDGTFTLSREIVDLKSLAIDPAQPNRLAACTNEAVWYSETSGRSWISLGSPSQVPGMKAVSFGPGQGSSQNAIWVSHAIKGIFTKDVNDKNGWVSLSTGVPKVFGANGEEVSSFALLPFGTQSGPQTADQPWRLLAGLSFLGKIIQWDPVKKTFIERYSDKSDFGGVESLVPTGSNAGYAISKTSIQRFALEPGNGKITLKPDLELTGAVSSMQRTLQSRYGDSALCFAFLPQASKNEAPNKLPPVALNELWLLSKTGDNDAPALYPIDPGKSEADSAAQRRLLANGKKGLYLQTGFVINPATRAKYFALIKSLGLDSIVVDMKDDYGRLRFAPRSPLLSATGSTGEVLDIESFAAEAKRQGIYLIARVVVFKDEALYKSKDAALAVRDAKTGLPWQGIKSDGKPILEYWVDPYSTDVWRYNVEIAKEVTGRGFDEVQFDYIRFPTDGENLSLARFPRQEAGMTQDSALESFLRFARQELEVPISVDIYGANGWYRSSTRTGQDVEMLSNYVDVICPMLYPSHFEQAFLAQAPAELRPYRIYRIGTLRNLAIAREKTLVRPYVQAFYLDVSYDKVYYDTHYVEEEVRGIRDGANQGMTFWNNSGRYDDVPLLR